MKPVMKSIYGYSFININILKIIPFFLPSFLFMFGVGVGLGLGLGLGVGHKGLIWPHPPQLWQRMFFVYRKVQKANDDIC